MTVAHPPPARCRRTPADSWERGHDAGIDLAAEVVRREVTDERLARRLVHELILAARVRENGSNERSPA